MANCRICNYKLKKIINLGKISLVGNFQKNEQTRKNIRLVLITVFPVSMFKFQKG